MKQYDYWYKNIRYTSLSLPLSHILPLTEQFHCILIKCTSANVETKSEP